MLWVSAWTCDTVVTTSVVDGSFRALPVSTAASSCGYGSMASMAIRRAADSVLGSRTVTLDVSLMETTVAADDVVEVLLVGGPLKAVVKSVTVVVDTVVVDGLELDDIDAAVL